MMNIEGLWKEYSSFEQSINPMIAEKLTQERSRDYMNARRVAKEYEAVTRGLNKSQPSIPPTGEIEADLFRGTTIIHKSSKDQRRHSSTPSSSASFSAKLSCSNTDLSSLRGRRRSETLSARLPANVSTPIKKSLSSSQ